MHVHVHVLCLVHVRLTPTSRVPAGVVTRDDQPAHAGRSAVARKLHEAGTTKCAYTHTHTHVYVYVYVYVRVRVAVQVDLLVDSLPLCMLIMGQKNSDVVTMYS